ncbi:MAG: PIN domain-containing protein [Luteitalea sp.]|nr:PIN domain-containing protein [Luteitalea sp.]
MSFLLDTNVVSEWVKPRPDPGVVAWLSQVDEDRVYISVVTLAELRHGIERLDNGKRRKRLDEWLSHELPLRFEGRVVLIDEAVADAWGKEVARREALGQAIAPLDAFMAATAHVHALTLVTRNVSDFESSLKAIVNPWSQT